METSVGAPEVSNPPETSPRAHEELLGQVPPHQTREWVLTSPDKPWGVSGWEALPQSLTGLRCHPWPEATAAPVSRDGPSQDARNGSRGAGKGTLEDSQRKPG